MLSCNSVSVHVRRGDYAVMRVLIAMMIVVPFCVLINDFIAIWVGAEYILPASVVMLLVMDLYILCFSFLHQKAPRLPRAVREPGRFLARYGLSYFRAIISV